MKVAIHQAQYFPYIGFFNKISIADVYVVMDNTPYQRGFINRNRIVTPDGSMWLTIPLIKSQGSLIKDVVINNDIDWPKQHLTSIERNYKRSPFFGEIFPKIADILCKRWSNINDLNVELIKFVLDYLKIDTKIVLETSLSTGGMATERLVNICKAIRADTYFSGPGTNDYMDKSLFRNNGIALVYQKFKHPVYVQRFGNTFQPCMAIIDLLFNKGKESRKIIMESGT